MRGPRCTISDMVHCKPPLPQIPPSGSFSIRFHVFFLSSFFFVTFSPLKLISPSQFFFHTFPCLPPSTLPSLHYRGISSLHVSLSTSLSFISFSLPLGSFSTIGARDYSPWTLTQLLQCFGFFSGVVS